MLALEEQPNNELQYVQIHLHKTSFREEVEHSSN